MASIAEFWLGGSKSVLSMSVPQMVSGCARSRKCWVMFCAFGFFGTAVPSAACVPQKPGVRQTTGTVVLVVEVLVLVDVDVDVLVELVLVDVEVEVLEELVLVDVDVDV